MRGYLFLGLTAIATLLSGCTAALMQFEQQASGDSIGLGSAASSTESSDSQNNGPLQLQSSVLTTKLAQGVSVQLTVTGGSAPYSFDSVTWGTLTPNADSTEATYEADYDGTLGDSVNQSITVSDSSGESQSVSFDIQKTGIADSSFGTDGLFTTNFGGSNMDLIWDIELLSNGKILAVGRANETATDKMGLAQIGTDGELDSSFGTSGKVVNATGYEARAVGVQSDGKIVIAGGSSLRDIYAIRYGSDGVIDTSFGNSSPVDGVWSATTGASSIADVYSLFIDSSDAIYLGADDSSGSGKIWKLAAKGNTWNMTSNASTFYTAPRGFALVGSDLWIASQSSNSDFKAEEVDLLNLDSADSIRSGFGWTTDIVTCGSKKFCLVGSNSGDMKLARFNDDGTVDTTFNASGGTPGENVVSFGTNSTETEALTVDAKNRILVAGYVNNGSGYLSGYVARFKENGTLDTSFGNSGSVTIDLAAASVPNTGDSTEFFDIAVRPDGRIIVAGKADRDSSTAQNWDWVIYSFYP